MRYQIPRRAQRCAYKEEPFSEKEEIVTLLTPQDEGFERKDLCQNCFEEQKENLLCNDEVSFWKVNLTPKLKKNKRDLQRDEVLLNLLRSYSDDGSDPTTVYLLCLFLERQKVLTKQKERKDDTFFFECIETGEVFIAKKTALSQDHLANLSTILV